VAAPAGRFHLPALQSRCRLAAGGRPAGYLNEFAFRFNRRRSRSRGLVFYRVLELAAGHDPVRYHDLIASQRPGAAALEPPPTRGHPLSPGRPARTARAGS
jgi:hypothetical protein